MSFKFDVEDLKRRVSILHVAGERVQLRKQGAEYMACCPFHDDSTPSLSVNPETGLWKCHGCGKGGDQVTWLQEAEGYTFQEAVRRLAEMAGVDEGPGGDVHKNARIVAEYDYVDEKGDLLYQVQRKEFERERRGKIVKDKTFLQRRPDGRGGWSWSVKEVRKVLYRLPEIIATDQPVWIVEGEKDVHSLVAIGIQGTTWAGGAKKDWLPPWTELLRGRRVILCPDNDAVGQERAELICESLAGACELHWVKIPAPHKDVSDFLAAGGTREQLEEMAAAAPIEPVRPPRPEVPKLWGRAAAHGKRECNEIAEEILTKHSILSDQFGYVHHYNSKYWERVTGKVLQRLAKDADTLEHTNRRRRGEIADYLEMATQQPQIHWRQVKQSEVPLANGVYDVLTGELRPHRKEDYLETVLPVELDPEAKCPNWEAALLAYFGEDPDKAQKASALQQFFGYCLLPHARFKKALILYGDGDTGKSQVAKLLQELVGRQNCCGVSVEAMDDERKRVPLVGKLLNVLTEISAKAVVADGGFKTLISTEEEMLFDPKYLPQFMYAPIAKHVVATNNLPQINDYTKATYNRLLVVKFNRVIPRSEQDPDFLSKLKAELPGVLNWALAGAADLTESGGEWVDIPESRRIIEDYRSRENEINSFIEEECVVDADGILRAPTLRDRFRRWAGKNYSQKAIGNMMVHAGYPGIPNTALGCRIHRGLRWREAGIE